MEIIVPVVGESITEVVLASWRKKDGDLVKLDEVIGELESDKATFDIPAPAAGVLRLVAKEGDTIAIGGLLGKIETGAATSAPAAVAAPVAETPAAPAPVAAVAAPAPTTYTMIVPAVGESITEVTINTWHKNDGDTVQKDEILCDVDSDKATFELPAEATGILHIVAIKGTTLPIGGVICTISGSDAPVATSQAASSVQKGQTLVDAIGALVDITNKASEYNIPPNTAESLISNVISLQVKANEISRKASIPTSLQTHLESLKQLGSVFQTVQNYKSLTSNKSIEIPDLVKINSGIDIIIKSIQANQNMPDISKILNSSNLLFASYPKSENIESPDLKFMNNIALQGFGVLSQILEQTQQTSFPSPIVSTTSPVAGSDFSDPSVANVVSPVVAAILAERGLTPADVKGTGPNGKITKDDAHRATKQAAPTATAAPAAAKAEVSGERSEERIKMTSLRKTISRRLVAVKNETAMLTTFNEVDMKPIMDLRTKYKDKFKDKHAVGLGFMSFFTKACSIALQEFPSVNAYIDGDEIINHHFVDISIAVSAPRGLVVPVIRNAEKMNFAEIEKEVVRLAGLARDSKLSIEQMTGGTFTITNGGIFGSMLSTPIINAPQSAILGMHNIVERAMVVNGEIVIRPIMYVALSYDHRIIDGRESVGFLVRVKQLLEDPTRILLDV